jgi:AraC-like DNA-binding protein
METIVRSSGLSGFAPLVRKLGQNPLTLLSDAGIDVACLDNPDLYITYQSMAKLLDLAATRCNAPDFGFRLGERQDLFILGALAPYLCSQPSLADSFAIMQRNLDFHVRGICFKLISLQNQHSIQLDFQPEFITQTPVDQLTALTISNLTILLGQLANNRIKPAQILLATANPGVNSNNDYGLGCAITFDSSINQVSYEGEIFALPVSINPQLHQRLKDHWRYQSGSVPRDGARLKISLEEQIQRAIFALLPNGNCRLDNVAQLVGLSPRVLQKRLRASAKSFSQILAESRFKIAKQYLQHSTISVTELSLNLGFEDPAVFSRTFKAWTNQSPREWRRGYYQT